MADVKEQQPRQTSTSKQESTADRLYSHLGGSPGVVIIKLLLLAIVNGIVLTGIPAMIEQRAWAMLAAAVIATLAIDVVYLRRDLLPLKYLVPGTVFLLAFQVYPVLNTFYLSFTNYGTGHILTQDQAIEQIEQESLVTPEDAIRYDIAPFAAGEDVALLLTDPDGAQFLGTADGLTPLEDADGVETADGQVTAIGDYERLTGGAVSQRSQALQDLRVPVEAGEIRLQTLASAALREQTLRYDADAGAMVDVRTGVEYTPEEGLFVSPDGDALIPGWRVPIGFDNYTRVFTSPQIRAPFIRVFVWTMAFALLSVVTTFALGMLLALALNKPGLRGLRTYRTLLIFPYALPSFLTALIWAGLLNSSFGAVNDLLGVSIPWLTDPTWAKISILLVNLWLGFPYMFIVTLGALQSIPGDLLEAARIDGATGIQAFRGVTFPLVLVSVAPLLISSFAFNFNNFNIVYLLTGGGPPIAGAQTPAGHTDILISYTYRLSFEGGRGPEYAFAAAIAVIIFIIVASISAYSFRYTKALEEM